MSEPTEPSGAAYDADAWATACEEDLAAERDRLRAEHGPRQVSAAEELRRLADAVASRVAGLGIPFAGPVGQAAARGVAQQFLDQARAVVEPVVARNPQVFDHLATAGTELLAAYRSAVREYERDRGTTARPWAGDEPGAEDGTERAPDERDGGPASHG